MSLFSNCLGTFLLSPTHEMWRLSPQPPPPPGLMPMVVVHNFLSWHTRSLLRAMPIKWIFCPIMLHIRKFSKPQLLSLHELGCQTFCLHMVHWKRLIYSLGHSTIDFGKQDQVWFIQTKVTLKNKLFYHLLPSCILFGARQEKKSKYVIYFTNSFIIVGICIWQFTYI